MMISGAAMPSCFYPLFFWCTTAIPFFVYTFVETRDTINNHGIMPFDYYA